MKPITLIRAIDNELKDEDRKEIIIFFIDAMNKPESLFEIKKILDDVVEYEKS